MTRTDKCIKQTEKVSARNYAPLPIVISKGDGVFVWDVEGKKYFDMLSSYSALNQGHSNKNILGALKRQASRLSLTSRAFHNDQMGPFLEYLLKISKMEMALPMNTGAEAVETALKAARKWGHYVKGVPKNKGEIIVCDNNFHGRTITIISFSGDEQYKDGFGPLTPGFKIIPFNDLKALEKAITKNTIAFLVEPIQGEGGINIPDEGFLSGAAKICKKNNILLMLDEIQVGLGRTGKMFAFQHEGIKPDVLILGKALGGGFYPVSAVLSRKDVLGVFNPGDHGSTFGGNPLGSAVGLASLKEIVQKKLDRNSERMGKYFIKKLRRIRSDAVKEIRGRGLLIGIEIKKEHGNAKKYCQKLMRIGVLCNDSHGHTIRIAPPLTITQAEIDSVIPLIERALTGKE